MAMYLGNKKVAITKKVVEYAPQLNIAYQMTAPTDTSKLWVKTANTPNNVSFRNVFNGAYDGGEILKLEETLPNTMYGQCCTTIKTDIYFIYSTNMYKFDTLTNTLTTLDITLPTSESERRCIAVNNDIYIFGGRDNSAIYKYNIISNTLSTLSITFNYHGMGLANIGTNIYVFGGDVTSTYGTMNSSIYKYDTLTNSFTSIASGYYGCDLACAVVGTDIYLLGGKDHSSNYISPTMYKFDTLTNTLTTLNTSLSTYGSVYIGVSVIGTNIYIFGGAYYLNAINTGLKITPYNKIRVFDTLTNKLTTLDSTLPRNLYDMSYGTIGLNTYFFGGKTDNSNINTIYEFQTQYTLQSNELQLIEAYNTTPLPFYTSDSLELNISIAKAYLGNSNNIAEPVEIYQYQNDTWTKVVS